MSRPDLAWAAAAGAIALGVYVRTLAPGLVAAADAPMFQFIGRVLGVPHNPGYPWYVLITWAFSYVPIGTLPYRINLFSALLGAVTVALAFLVARRLECGRLISLGAALALAYGHVFWSQAVIAEVYTMHAAILAGMLLALLAWRDSRRPLHFFIAVALFAIGIGHHTTIVAFAPGLALFAVLRDRSFALRPQTVAVSGAILLAGLVPYSYVLVRSTTPGVYAESQASTLPQLADVILARQFQDRVFAFDWRSILLDRIPAVSTALLQELTPTGVALAAVGLGWLLVRRTPAGLLLLSGGAAVTAFAVVYRVVDTPVFLIPAIVVLWVAAGAGAERLVRLLRRWPARAAAAAMLVLPAWLLAHNVEATDRSRDTGVATYFDALFDALPARAAIVHEDFLVDRLVMFKLLGDGAARGRDIELVPRDKAVLRSRQEEGVPVFAFQKSARQLRREGVGFSFRPQQLFGGQLPALLAGLEDGSIVAVAIPAAHLNAFGAAGGAAFGAIGGPAALQAVRDGSSVVLLGVRGAGSGARVQAAAGSVRLAAARNRRIGETQTNAPADIEIGAGAEGSEVRLDGRTIVSAADGVVIAIWNEAGGLAQTLVLEAANGFRTRVPAGDLAVYRLRAFWPETHVTGDAADVSNVFGSGSAIVHVPAAGSVVVYLADERPLAPQLADRSSNDVSVGIASIASADALREALSSDGMQPDALPHGIETVRVEITASRGRGAVLLAAGGIPRQAIARAAGAPRAVMIPVDLSGLLRTPDGASEVLLMHRDEQAQLIGPGWSRVDADAVAAYRWITAPEARLVLPATVEPSRLRLHVYWDRRRGEARIALRLDRTRLAAQPLVPGWQLYEWTVPAGSLRPGITDAAVLVESAGVSVERPAARSGVAVSELRLTR